MPYQHYIFVSYKRDGPAAAWVQRVFLPHLRGLAEGHYGVDKKGEEHVFSDDQLRGGVTWRTALDLAICGSRILVPVFDAAYFDSPYCRQEISHMREREEKCGLRSTINPDGLIVPVHISKSDLFPDEATNLQGRDFFDYKSSSLAERKGSPLYEAFERAMDALFEDIKAAIDRRPAHDPAWRQLEGEAYMPLFYRKPCVEPEQLPRLAAA